MGTRDGGYDMGLLYDENNKVSLASEEEDEVNPASDTSEKVDVATYLSKNQARKQAKYIRTVEKKKNNRKREQEKHREKYKVCRQNGGQAKGDVRRAQLERLSQSLLTGPKVCIDLQFEELMNDKELNHLANQLKRVYSSNKAAITPFHLHFLSLQKQSRTYSLCVDKNEGFANYLVTLEERGVTEVFDPAEVVYLSPDSDQILDSFDDTKVYVIGGLVGDSVKKNTSSQFSRGNQLRTCRLPIAEHMVRNEAGTYKQILTINQVFDILLNFHQTNDWQTALGADVP